MRWYRLNSDKTTSPVEDFEAWVREEALAANMDRVVQQTQVTPSIWISTVFLGLDHQYGSGPPLLFETMVFKDGSGGELDRYATWEEAEKGHWRMVAKYQKRHGTK